MIPPDCAPFFQSVEHVAGAIARGEYDGTLRVDVGPLEMRTIFPEAARRFAKKHANVQLDIAEIPHPDLTRLRSGQTDLLIEYVESVPRGFEQCKVGSHRIFLVAASGHKAWQRGTSPKAFHDQPLVTFTPSSPEAARQLDAVSAWGPPRRIASASSTEGILALVAAGLGYSIIPWPSASGPSYKGVRSLRIKGPGTEFPIAAVWREGKATKLVQAFVETMTDPRRSR